MDGVEPGPPRRDDQADKEDALAFGNDFVKGGQGKDDVYGLLGNDWLEGNEEEDAIVGDMGKIVDNQLNGPTPDELADPSPLNQFIAPKQPFLGSTVNYTGMLKREVTLYAFDQSVNTAGIGHDVALGGAANDWIHTGPGEDLANGNAGDDRIFLGDNFTREHARRADRLAHDRVDAGWGGGGHDHIFGGYGADYLDVRPRTTAGVPGLFPASDPETWFQVAGGEASQKGVLYNQDNFDDIDYIYGGWDQDTLQANKGDNGPVIGDRLLDWGGSYNGYYLCPVDLRGLGLDPRSRAGRDRVPAGESRRATGRRRPPRRARPGSARRRSSSRTRSRATRIRSTRTRPAHFTCGAGTTIP